MAEITGLWCYFWAMSLVLIVVLFFSANGEIHHKWEGLAEGVPHCYQWASDAFSREALNVDPDLKTKVYCLKQDTKTELPL
jgi:hypothetical protein